MKLLLTLCVTIFSVIRLAAEPIPVKHQQGLLRGFLIVRDVQDKVIGTGNLLQTTTGNQVTVELILQFKDGSIYDETSVYSQRRTFHVLAYHLVQKGPTFKGSLDFTLDVPKGQAKVREIDEDGKEKTFNDHLTVPTDLANGILPTLILNVDTAVPKTVVSMVVATPKPRIVKLEISPSGEESFSVSGFAQKANRFTVKIDIGGLGGLIAPLIGKQPPDAHVWVIEGKAPGFLKLETALALGGPVWTIELASPVWAK